MQPQSFSWDNISRALCLLFGLLFAALAFFSQQFFHHLISNGFEGLHLTQAEWVYLCFSLLFLACYFFYQHIPAIRHFLGNRIAVNTLFVLFILIAPVALLEVVLNQFRQIEVPNRGPSLFVEDAHLGWRMKPNTRAQCGNIYVQVNNHGLRGSDTTYEKPAGTYRLLLLGDSVTFGHNLENDREIYPAVLQEKLNTESEKPIEVINAGVNGYSTWHQHEYLIREGYQYSPDAVMLGFVLNDIYETHRIVNHGLFEHSPIAWFEGSSIVYYLRKWSLQIRYRTDAQQAAQLAEGNEMQTLVENPSSPDIAHIWQPSLQYLQKMNEFCIEREIPFIVALFPIRSQKDASPTTATPQQYLSERLAERNILAWNLHDALSDRLQKHHLQASDYFIDETHFSAQGSIFIAEILQEYLQALIDENEQR